MSIVFDLVEVVVIYCDFHKNQAYELNRSKSPPTPSATSLSSLFALGIQFSSLFNIQKLPQA